MVTCSLGGILILPVCGNMLPGWGICVVTCSLGGILVLHLCGNMLPAQVGTHTNANKNVKQACTFLVTKCGMMASLDFLHQPSQMSTKTCSKYLQSIVVSYISKEK